MKDKLFFNTEEAPRHVYVFAFLVENKSYFKQVWNTFW